MKPSSPDLIYKIPNEELVKKALESLKLVDSYMRTRKDSDKLDKALEILSNSINQKLIGEVYLGEFDLVKKAYLSMRGVYA